MWRKREPLTPRTTLELSHCNHVHKRQLPSPQPKERGRTLFKPPPRDLLLGESPLNARAIGERDLSRKRRLARSRSPERRKLEGSKRQPPIALRLVGPALDDLRVKVECILAQQEKLSGEVTRLEGKVTLQDVESITSNLLESVGTSRAKWELYRRVNDRCKQEDGGGYEKVYSSSRKKKGNRKRRNKSKSRTFPNEITRKQQSETPSFDRPISAFGLVRSLRKDREVRKRRPMVLKSGTPANKQRRQRPQSASAARLYSSGRGRERALEMKQEWFGRLRLDRPKSANALATKAKQNRYREPYAFEMSNPSTLIKRLRRVRNEIVGIYAELGDVAVETAEAAARDAAIEARERRQVHCGHYEPPYELDTDLTCQHQNSPPSVCDHDHQFQRFSAQHRRKEMGMGQSRKIVVLSSRGARSC